MPPMFEILAYLTGTFLLGLSLGAAIWKLGAAQSIGTVETEKDYWQKRVQQFRLERDRDQDKIEVLEAERNKLRDRLKSAQATPSKKAS